MLLSMLARDAGITYDGKDAEIVSIEYDSRKVVSGSLFCCCVGLQLDGHNFAESAIRKGAAALVVEHPLPFDVPQVVVPNARQAMADMASAFFGHPEREMHVLGVTGTNGKTTTTYMVKSIAEHAGMKVGVIGTIRNMIGSESLHTDRTTPESVDLFRLLRVMADAGVDMVVMEVSSHALEQNRVHGIRFDVGLFTNLTQDHLDYHKTFDNYLNAKKLLFRQSAIGIINRDDYYAERMMEGLTLPLTTFGVSANADIHANDIDITAHGVTFDLYTPNGNCRINLNIPGLFSVYNAMGSAAMALAVGIPLVTVKQGLESLSSVSGRLESVPNDRGYSVFVDYAHTPDALENVLKTCREFAKRRVICLFGCGGDRDHAKRPQMGEIAGRYSDFAVVTSDNPRTENPMDIIDSIEEGVKRSGAKYAVIENRREAIAYALSIAEEDDIVLLAGKGHENYQEINGTKFHFDDKEAVLELLSENK